MEYGSELMSRKADLLKNYLTETQGLGECIQAVETESFDFDALAEKMEKRAEIIAKIDEIDGLLARKQFSGEQAVPDMEKHKWLCDKMVQQIAETEQANRELFAQMIGKLEDAMRKNSESIRGINAYFQLDMQPMVNQEWKK